MTFNKNKLLSSYLCMQVVTVLIKFLLPTALKDFNLRFLAVFFFIYFVNLIKFVYNYIIIVNTI